MNKWENFGDANPLEYGGIWIKKDEDTKNAFYVVKNELIDDNEDNQRILDLYVDLNDSWIDKKAVLDYIGLENEQDNLIQFLIGVTNYYSYENFGTAEMVGSKDNVKKELKKYDIII